MNHASSTRPDSVRRGALLSALAALLPLVAILTLFTLNLAYMELARTQLRIATDAATRAGGRKLAQTGDLVAAKAAARNAAVRNNVAGTPLQLAEEDFVFGVSRRNTLQSRYAFEPTSTRPNAIQVTGRRTVDSLNGSVQLYFPKLLGWGIFEPQQQATATQVELDIALVLDRSNSMALADDSTRPAGVPVTAPSPEWVSGQPAPANSRWRDVVAATHVFLSQFDQCHRPVGVSLTTFGESVTVDLPLTQQHAEVLPALDAHSRRFLGGHSNVAKGVDAGLVTLLNDNRRPWAAKAILLVTDGDHSPGQHPLTIARESRQQGVMIFPVTVSSDACTEMMQQIARYTGGRHFHASNGSELIYAFQEIADNLPTLLVQ